MRTERLEEKLRQAGCRVVSHGKAGIAITRGHGSHIIERRKAMIDDTSIFGICAALGLSPRDIGCKGR